MRRIEVPTDTPTEFYLGDTAADIQEGGEEGGRKHHREEIEREEARRALRGANVKWTQRVKERQAHFKLNPGATKER